VGWAEYNEANGLVYFFGYFGYRGPKPELPELISGTVG